MTTLTQAAEAGSLAHELGRARTAIIEQVRKQYGLKPADAAAQVEQTDLAMVASHALTMPARTMSWYNLDAIAATDPVAAVTVWEEIKAEARADLQSGHRAAMVLELSEVTCWKRAQFLAMRDDLAVEWRPRNGVEWSLIDCMTQALTQQYYWTQRIVELDSLAAADLPEERKTLPPRVPTAQAIDQAAGMVDRFNRMFMRAVRQLRDLRRYTTNILVQNAGQVNVGEQVNVANVGDEKLSRSDLLVATS